jgi:acyl-CoA thioesterase FadM
MNLYLRLLLIIIKIKRLRLCIEPEGTSRISFRVWPHDCDLNLHLTNSRYLAFMDLARIWMLAEMDILASVLKNRWMPVVHSLEITYIKPLKPFQKFYVQSYAAGWGDKYIYIEQDFVVGDTVYAKAMIRGLFVKNGKPVPVEDVTRVAGNPVSPDNLKQRIKTWIQLIELKKD